jgi:hypothetical protein
MNTPTFLICILLALIALTERCEGVELSGESSQIYPCNIKKVNVTHAEEVGNLIREFPLEPVVFVGARDRNQVLAEAASKHTLRDLYGDTLVTLASSNTYSHDTIDMTLSEYLGLIERDAHLSRNAKANETYYLFGNNFSELFRRLEGHYVLPPCTHCKEAGND